MPKDECVHGMVPEWCAICKGIKSPEEEAAEESNSFDDWLDKL